MMAENKTQPTAVNPVDFLNTVENEQRRADALALLGLIRDVTGEEPVMWGEGIVGFGRYHYKYDSGREGDAPLAGFSPRKANLVVYIMGASDQYEDLRPQLGKHSVGKVCLYVKRLSDVDPAILREMVARSVAHTRAIYPS